MKKILVMDEKNYPPDMAEIYRVAVRGIIFIEDKLLMIESSFGELKLPGGGIEDGEDDSRALAREVKEETGYDVNMRTISEKKRGFRQVLYSLEDAIEKNRRMLENEGMQAWNQREYQTLLLLRDHFRS